ALMYKKTLAGLTGIALTAVLATPAAADSWRDDQYWLEDYGFTSAWDTSQGEDVTVGIIDTGVADSRPDLPGQLAGGYEASGSCGWAVPRSMGPHLHHGTMVASFLAGQGHGAPRDDEEDEDADDDADDSVDEAQDDVAPIDQSGTDGILGAAPKVELLSVA